MSWLGAGIGAGIGMAIGGPIGAGIGALIGSAVGSGENKELIVVCPHCQNNVQIESEGLWTCPHCRKQFMYGDTECNQTIFFVALISMLAKMAKADGIVCEKEIALVTNFFEEIELDTEDKKAAITIFNNAKSDNISIYEYAKQYSEIAEYEMRNMVYALLWDVALSDGTLHNYEDQILREITTHLGLPDSLYTEYKASMLNDNAPNIEECYRLLGCTENDTDQVIKQKYRKAVADYHPDKIQSKGLPQGFLDYANEQIIKINKAYEYITVYRKST